MLQVVNVKTTAAETVGVFKHPIVCVNKSLTTIEKIKVTECRVFLT